MPLYYNVNSPDTGRRIYRTEMRNGRLQIVEEVTTIYASVDASALLSQMEESGRVYTGVRANDPVPEDHNSRFEMVELEQKDHERFFYYSEEPKDNKRFEMIEL